MQNKVFSICSRWSGCIYIYSYIWITSYNHRKCSNVNAWSIFGYLCQCASISSMSMYDNFSPYISFIKLSILSHWLPNSMNSYICLRQLQINVSCFYISLLTWPLWFHRFKTEWHNVIANVPTPKSTRAYNLSHNLRWFTFSGVTFSVRSSWSINTFLLSVTLP